jgi:ABC-2 type transport system ATP-binding protein
MIEIENMSFAYKKKPNLFDGLNLSLAGGNIYGLLGKNGFGKTTLLKIIAGLLFPREGTCNVLGVDPKNRRPDVLSEIYFLPEEFSVPRLTVKEYEYLYSPFYPRFKKAEFRGWLNDFSLADSERLSSLSHGQKKKFLLAFGLATDTRILILDEPTNGLDIPGKSQFRKMLAAAIGDERIFLVSTHHVRDMQQLIDPVIILSDGKIVFQKSIGEINENLNVELRKEEPDPQTSLYHEKILGGYSVLCGGEGNGRSGIDLELLFSAVMRDSRKINSAFKGGAA